MKSPPFYLLVLSTLSIILSGCNEADKTHNSTTTIATTSTSCLNKSISEIAWIKKVIADLEQSPTVAAEIIQYTHKNDQRSFFEITACINCPDGVVQLFTCSGTEVCQFDINGVQASCDYIYNQLTNKEVAWSQGTVGYRSLPSTP